MFFSGVVVAFVEDSRKDNSSRNVFRYKEFDNKILLSKIQDYFICKFFCFKTKFLNIFEIIIQVIFLIYGQYIYLTLKG